MLGQFLFAGTVPPLVYFAFVNYTTLGYGDIIPVQAWQILGPAAAMNGVLLIRLVDCGHFRSVEKDNDGWRQLSEYEASAPYMSAYLLKAKGGTSCGGVWFINCWLL
jgi:Ion channel